MRRRGLLIGLGLALGLAPGVVSDSAGRVDGLWLTGEVTVAADDVSQTVVVTIDHDTGVVGADGLVDHAFRVQRPSALMTFWGRATVYARPGVLVVYPHDRETAPFGFVAARADAADTDAGLLFAAMGISRHWGDALAASADETTARLLAAPCGGGMELDALAGCSPCQVGGPGQSACELPDGAPPCEAVCRDGSYACCNDPNDCRCCPDIEQ